MLSDSPLSLASIADYFPLLILATVRMYAAWSFLPLLGPHVLGPALIRNAVIIAFSLPIFLQAKVLLTSTDVAPGIGVWLGIFLNEVFIGSLIGWIATIPFWALDMACYLMDTLRGASMSGVLNPLLGSSSSVLGLFFSQLVAVLFLSFGGLFALLRTLYASYVIVPFGESLVLDTRWLVFLQQQWGYLSALALTFALPAVTMMILIDTALGLLNRAAKQLNVFFIAMPIKSLMTMFLLAVSLEFAALGYVNEMERLTEKVLPFLQVCCGGKDRTTY